MDCDRWFCSGKHEWQLSTEITESDDKFERLRESALKTARAWALKEGAMGIWHYTSRTWAEKAWEKWLGWAQRSRLQPMVKVAKTVRNHLWGIVNAVIHGVTSATAEGVNSGIQRLQNRACGYRSRDAYRTAIDSHFGRFNLAPAMSHTHTNQRSAPTDQTPG